jgi:hypothetical protein
MRPHLVTAFFAFFSLVTLQGISQGRMHSPPIDLYSLFEKPMSCEEILKNAIALDSIREAEKTLLTINDDPENDWKNWTSVGNYTYGKNRGDIPMINDLNALHPYFRDKVQQLISICKAKGIQLAFVETYRTHSKQAEYKGMGRKYTRSGAGKSKHQYGFAVDVVPIVNDTACWHDKVLWKKVGVVGEQLGLRWGGRWRYPYDPGHFEWTGGLNTLDLATGKEPFIPKKNQLYPCLEEDLKLLKKYWAAWEAEQSAQTRR